MIYSATLLLACAGAISAYTIGNGASPACTTCGSYSPPVPAPAPVVCSTCQYTPPCATCPQQPVVGEWSQWSQWSPCVMQYGTLSQTRRRTCSTATCVGSAEEAQPCATTPAPVPQYDPPTWTEWGNWGACSASCGGGVCQRTRTCVNTCSVCQCVGAAVEQKPCNTQPCCSWSAWSGWSSCSVTCGSGGTQSRTRVCSCQQCAGEASEVRSCNAQSPCPACNTCYQPVAPVPSPCTTCGTPVYTPPVYSNPITTGCTTCGQGAQPYYDPYSNGSAYGKKKRGAEEEKEKEQQ